MVDTKGPTVRWAMMLFCHKVESDTGELYANSAQGENVCGMEMVGSPRIFSYFSGISGNRAGYKNFVKEKIDKRIPWTGYLFPTMGILINEKSNSKFIQKGHSLSKSGESDGTRVKGFGRDCPCDRFVADGQY